MPNEGKKLLILFRAEQAVKGRDGCQCDDCQKDMQEAYEKFVDSQEE